MYSLVNIALVSFLIVTTCGSDTAGDILGAVQQVLPGNALDIAKSTLGKGDDDVIDKLTNRLSSVLDPLPFSKNGSDLPSLDEGEDLFRRKCEKSGKNITYDSIQNAKEDLQACLKVNLNFETMHDEIEKNKHNGSLDIVFKKYCKKMPILKACIVNFTSAVEPCLEGKEKVAKDILLNVTESLDKFICFKEGDRIALFIAEGGPECLTDKAEAIQQCVNQTYAKRGGVDIPDINSIDKLPMKLEDQDCRDVDSVQHCIVTELEKCSEPTPANIVDSLMNFIRQSTPCAVHTSGASSVQTSHLFIAASLSLISMFRFLYY